MHVLVDSECVFRLIPNNPLLNHYDSNHYDMNHYDINHYTETQEFMQNPRKLYKNPEEIVKV
jgi:hypothetical protein